MYNFIDYSIVIFKFYPACQQGTWKERNNLANHSFCENCGTPCPLGDRLCASCASQVQTEFNRPNPGTQQRQQPQRSGGSKILIPIIIGVLVIIIAVVALIMIFRGSKTDSGAESLESTTQETTVMESETEDPAPSAGEQTTAPGSTTEAEATTSCISCGATIAEDAQFCPQCGQSQTVTEEEEEVVEEEPKPITMGVVDSSSVDTGSLSKVSVDSAYGTSVVSQSGNHDNTANVTLDNDLTTSWQEGVDGSGVGEGIVYNLDGEYFVQYLAFNLGNWRTADWYAQNNVPQALDIVINEEIYRVSFDYGQKKYWVALSEPVLTDCVEIYIAAAYPGSEYNDTCIAEVGIYGDPA